MGPRTFTAVWKVIALWYNCCLVCESPSRWLYDGEANGDLLRENLGHVPRILGLPPGALSLQQATADPCLHGKPSDTHRQVWLSLL